MATRLISKLIKRSAIQVVDNSKWISKSNKYYTPHVILNNVDLSNDNKHIGNMKHTKTLIIMDCDNVDEFKSDQITVDNFPEVENLICLDDPFNHVNILQFMRNENVDVYVPDTGHFQECYSTYIHKINDNNVRRKLDEYIIKKTQD